MSYCKSKTEEPLSIEFLTEEFISGCKTEQKTGMEYERIPVIKSSHKQVPYLGDYGICELLKSIAKKDNWDYILDGKNIIGLKKMHDTITLEPGCQFELSLEPQKFIKHLKNKIENIDKIIKPILEEFEIELLNKGITPVSTYKNIDIIPKERYHIMANYLWGILSDVMMRETAGIQVGIDYSSEEDCMRKFKLANIMSPFCTAMFANSKIRGGVDTGYKSFRALSWLNTDNERCGFATNFNNDMSFDGYVKRLLNTPMIFINRQNKTVNLNGQLTFMQFIKDGFEGFKATLDDWKLHSNLYFPEVRLRNFIEIRNHDCVGGGLEYSVPTLYKGIMYSDSALKQTEELLGQFSVNDIRGLRYNIPKDAIQAKINRMPIIDICKELVKISFESLKSNKEQEEEYLLPLIDILNQNKCPADIMAE